MSNQHKDAETFLFSSTEAEELLANEDDPSALPYCRLGNIDWDAQPLPYSFKLNWWDVDAGYGDIEFEFTQTTPLDTVVRSPDG